MLHAIWLRVRLHEREVVVKGGVAKGAPITFAGFSTHELEQVLSCCIFGMPVPALVNNWASIPTSSRAMGERCPMGIWTGREEDHSPTVLFCNPKDPKTVRVVKALTVREEAVLANALVGTELPTVESTLQDWPCGPSPEDVEPLNADQIRIYLEGSGFGKKRGRPAKEASAAKAKVKHQSIKLGHGLESDEPEPNPTGTSTEPGEKKDSWSEGGENGFSASSEQDPSPAAASSESEHDFSSGDILDSLPAPPPSTTHHLGTGHVSQNVPGELDGYDGDQVSIFIEDGRAYLPFSSTLHPDKETPFLGPLVDLDRSTVPGFRELFTVADTELKAEIKNVCCGKGDRGVRLARERWGLQGMLDAWYLEFEA